MKIRFFDCLTHTKQVLLHEYPHSFCDGVIVKKNVKTVVCFANRSLKNQSNTLAVLKKLKDTGLATSPGFSMLVEYLNGGS